jgi:molybdopterin-guanine dinucleotide biosynthesis protein A
VGITGVLLVGGASRRFGSPKPLAPFAGTTLAEHAWELLAWCDERIAVGKQADALALPFPVVDDGVPERAAIFGLRAGLAHARCDVCLFLPVDLPLVNEEILRRLAAGVAVPQTGPLPGAYPVSAAPEVERRIRRGDYALRGLAQNVLRVDEALLANANTTLELAAAAAQAAGAGPSSARTAAARSSTRAPRPTAIPTR